MTGWTDKITGRVRADGVMAAAKQGISEMNFLKEGASKKLAFGRIGGVGVGAALVGHALFKSQTKDGEQRSTLLRVGEGVIGVGAIGAGLMAGKGTQGAAMAGLLKGPAAAV